MNRFLIEDSSIRPCQSRQSRVEERGELRAGPEVLAREIDADELEADLANDILRSE